jgi:glycosyltransferase involved in cell wall biosynthesis
MNHPFASVITPVLNAEDRISPFLEAVRHQSYPSECYEIIVVDNGSTDQTKACVRSHSDVILLERRDIQNPYAARNTGLQNAKGNVIALLDVNCLPVKHWLECGVERLLRSDADLVGGHISFTFSREETLGEWYDSLLFVDMEDLIRRGKSCAGGNLMFNRKVMEAIGLFPENQRSGMDLYWTKKATSAGFTLVYDRNAEVRYPARKLKPLLKKVFRVGTGQPRVWLDNRMSPVKLAFLILYQFIPPGIQELKQKIRRRGKQDMYDYIGALWAIHYLQRVTLSLGWTVGLLRYYWPVSRV